MSCLITEMLLFLVASALCNLALGANLPKEIKTCKRRDANINNCVKQALQESLTTLYPGIPSLKLQPLDPLFIDKLVIDKKKNDGSPVDVDLAWENVTITGTKSAKITNVEVDWDKGFVSFETELQEPVDISGTYVVDGVVLVLPIKGSGQFDVKLEGFKAHIRIHGHEEERGGDKYMEVEKLAYTFHIAHMSIHYDNLFNGNKDLGDSMNNFLNENWDDIVQEMTPAIEAAFSSHFQDVAKDFFSQVPMSQIAPD